MDTKILSLNCIETSRHEIGKFGLIQELSFVRNLQSITIFLMFSN